MAIVFVCANTNGLAAVVEEATNRNVTARQATIIAAAVGGGGDQIGGRLIAALDHKLTSLLLNVANVDANIKALQEKAHVWEIYRHHIDAWREHMKSVDKKLDLLKQSHENVFQHESRIAIMEFKVQHIFEKVDTINEKMHDLIKIMYQQQHRACTNGTESTHNNNNNHNTAVKLNTIQKLLTSISNVPFCRGDANTFEQTKLNLTTVSNRNGGCTSAEMTVVKSFLKKIQSTIELKSKDLNHIITANRRLQQNVDNLGKIVQAIDDRTIRYVDQSASVARKQLQCCTNTKREINTFTSSADLLLKKLESIMLKSNARGVAAATAATSTITTNTVASTNNHNCECDKPSVCSKLLLLNDDLLETESNFSGSGGQVASGDLMNENDRSEPTKTGCAQLTVQLDTVTHSKSTVNGIYKFGLGGRTNAQNRDFYEQYCEFATDGPAWTIIQRRGNFDGVRENFNRSWNDYKFGFGDLSREFWFGNEFIQILTEEDAVDLRIELEDFRGNIAWAEFSVFRLAPESDDYRLTIDGFRGAIANSMSEHSGHVFSTFDRYNNDFYIDNRSCAAVYGCGWWFTQCYEANLNGIIHKQHNSDTSYKGIVWEKWMNEYSLKGTKMMVRPKDLLWLNENDDDFVEL